MLMIRFARRGKKNSPFFRILVSEKTKDLYGTALEELGWYNPATPGKPSELNEDRIRHWLSRGAKASPAVHNLLLAKKVIEGKKTPVYSPKKGAKKDSAAS